MHIRGIIMILALTVTVFTAASVSAFNGERKGFVLGFGIGPGYTNFSQEVGGIESDSEGKLSFVTDFRIGGGFNEQFLLYYENRVSWFKTTVVDHLWYDPVTEDFYTTETDVTIAHGIGLVGISYYFKPEVPSF